MLSLSSLIVVCWSRNISTMAGPVSVDVLALFAKNFVSVRTEKVSLGLERQDQSKNLCQKTQWKYFLTIVTFTPVEIEYRESIEAIYNAFYSSNDCNDICILYFSPHKIGLVFDFKNFIRDIIINFNAEKEFWPSYLIGWWLCTRTYLCIYTVTFSISNVRQGCTNIPNIETQPFLHPYPSIDNTHISYRRGQFLLFLQLWSMLTFTNARKRNKLNWNEIN